MTKFNKVYLYVYQKSHNMQHKNCIVQDQHDPSPYNTMGSLGGDLKKMGSRQQGGEGVHLEIGMVHELGRVAEDAVVPEVHLVLGDQVGGDDSVNIQVIAKL